MAESAEGPSQRYPSVDLLLKFAALPAVVIYGLLFIAYRNYYGRLGLDPESVGVDSAFVLVRSAGLILLVLFFCSISAASQLADQRMIGRWSGKSIAGLKSLLAIPFASFLVALFDPNLQPLQLVGLSAVTFAACAAQAVPITIFRRFGGWSDSTVFLFVLLIGLGATAVALTSRARYDADQVLTGCEIQPSQFLAIPILDLSTSRVVLTWLGPGQQRPAEFGGASGSSRLAGLLVGHGPSELYVLVGQPPVSLVRVPSALSMESVSLRPVDCSN